MKTNFSFSLGNMSLLPEEESLVASVNAKLKASALRHGKRLKPASVIAVKTVTVGSKTVRRAAPVNQDPVDIPLAPA